MLVSIIIRTFNEQKYLESLLLNILGQKCEPAKLEIVIVDSGSTDSTLEIAARYPCQIIHIRKSDFTFGRSLNMGCEAATGELFIFISGHCLPTNEHWLNRLVSPLVEGKASYSYGRQEGKHSTKYSEYQHFEKSFPAYDKIPQDGFFCNNANAALTREAWLLFRFNEELTGLEDMFLAKQLVRSGMKIAYSFKAAVYHIHDETWRQVRIRYEREAYALQRIMPEVHFTLGDFMRFFVSGLFSDSATALLQKKLLKTFPEIFMFRLMHYWGTYKGHQEMRKISTKMKYQYFYPKDLDKKNYEKKNSRVIADKS